MAALVKSTSRVMLTPLGTWEIVMNEDFLAQTQNPNTELMKRDMLLRSGFDFLVRDDFEVTVENLLNLYQVLPGYFLRKSWIL